MHFIVPIVSFREKKKTIRSLLSGLFNSVNKFKNQRLGIIIWHVLRVPNWSLSYLVLTFVCFPGLEKLLQLYRVDMVALLIWETNMEDI